MTTIKSNSNRTKFAAANGFSLIELLVVLSIIVVMTAISLPYIVSYKKAYKSEDQALKLMDLLRETNQYALTRRRTMRLEIDLTDNKILIIDEKGAGAADDLELKAIPLEAAGDIRVDQKPSGVSKPNPPDYNDAVYAIDSTGHKRGATTVTGHNVWAARFQRDGSIVNAAGTVFSANLYIWTPLTPGNNAEKDKKEVRAVTLFGGSGAVRYWKHNGTAFVAN